MTIPNKMLGIKGDECQCGRRYSIRHCIVCGSTRLYARRNRLHQFANGDTRLVTVELVCQSCGHLFVEEERQWCDAPAVNTALARQKIQAVTQASEQGEPQAPDEEALANAVKTLSQDKKDKIVEAAKKHMKKVKSEDDPLAQTRLRNSWFQLKGAYKDVCIEAEQKGETVAQTREEFLIENLNGFGISQENIDKVLQWQREEDSKNGQQQSS